MGKTSQNACPIRFLLVWFFKDPGYIGMVRWTPTGRAVGLRNYHHPDTITKKSTHEPIISQELWDKAQEQMRISKEIYRKREKSTAKLRTWLHGIVKCGKCGKTFVSQGNEYLQCNGYAKGTCKPSQSIKTVVLERLVLEELKKTFLGKLEINVIQKATDTTTRNDYELIIETLSRLDLKEVRIKEAYQDGIDTLEEYKENKSKLDNERQRLKNEHKNLKAELVSSKETEPEIYQRIQKVYELLSDETVSLQDKYQTAHYILEEITHDRHEKVLKIQYK